MSAPGTERARAWLAVALWTALVWTLSSDAFSAHSTSRFLGPLVRWLWPGVSEEALAAIHFAVRKAAHVAEYAVLGALVLRAARIGSRGPLLRAAALAVAFGAAVATADELRQSRSAERTGALADVALDAAGSVGGVAAALAFGRARRVRSRRRTRDGAAGVPSPRARG